MKKRTNILCTVYFPTFGHFSHAHAPEEWIAHHWRLATYRSQYIPSDDQFPPGSEDQYGPNEQAYRMALEILND